MSHCWTLAHRWVRPWWSAAGPAQTAAAPVPPSGSCGRGGRSGGTGPGWYSPYGHRPPCALHPCPADWRRTQGRSASWAPYRAPLTPLMVSYLDGPIERHWLIKQSKAPIMDISFQKQSLKKIFVYLNWYWQSYTLGSKSLKMKESGLTVLDFTAHLLYIHLTLHLVRSHVHMLPLMR